MIPLAVAALLVGPFVIGPSAFVLAFLLFALAGCDIAGHRYARRMAVRRDVAVRRRAAAVRRLSDELERGRW